MSQQKYESAKVGISKSMIQQKYESDLVRNVFLLSATHPYTTYGFNIANNTKFIRSYSLSDQLCAQNVWNIRIGMLL